MTAAENRKKDAFTLFESGEYERSYALCRELQQIEDDPSISVLCAANLFHMGKLEEAEAFFRDSPTLSPMHRTYTVTWVGFWN